MSQDFHIPTITLVDSNSDELESTIKALRHACENIGFFYLQIHNNNNNNDAAAADDENIMMTSHFISKVFQQSKQFFNLPRNIKEKFSNKVLNRGYTAMYEETLDPTKQRMGDTKEGFYISHDISMDSEYYNPAKLSGPNVWPTCNDDGVVDDDMFDLDCIVWKNTMNEYFEKMKRIGFRLVQLLALAIGLPEHYFDDKFNPPMAVLRLLHYSNQKSDPSNGIYACGAHSDYGMVTLLATDENPGLQILVDNNDNKEIWIDVDPPPSGVFIVNLGDMLERWTNGKFKSTVHRVICSGETERYSIPFFYEPNFDTVVECLETCIDQGEKPKYESTTAGEHLLSMYNQTHADFQSK